MSIAVPLILLLLICVNALYVAAEFAAVSVRRSRLQQLAESGDWLAKRLLPTFDDPTALDRFVAACQIGITISSLLLGAYGQAALAPVLAPVFQSLSGWSQLTALSAAATAVLILLTILQMVLGELVPKSIALQYPTGTARMTALPMQLSLRLLSWFIVLLNGSGLLILRLFGVRSAGHPHLHSPDEIEYLFAESRQGGLLEPDEHRRLKHALHLGKRRVDELMIPRVRIEGLDVTTPFAEAARRIAGSANTRLPLYEGSLDRVVGFLHIRDVARRSLTGDPPPLRDMMRPMLAVPHSLSAEAVLERLRAERQHIALVVDEFGGTAGLITVGDILGEIFGGVIDEYRSDEPGPERLPDGRIRLAGSLRLEDAEPWVGARWEGASHTVGGYVMERLGRVPVGGERLRLDPVEVEVERVDGSLVVSVIVHPREGDDDVDAAPPGSEPPAPSEARPPTAPTAPTAPGEPGAPTAPEPVAPAEPTAPEPIAPAEPGGPIGPGEPGAPGDDAQAGPPTADDEASEPAFPPDSDPAAEPDSGAQPGPGAEDPRG